MAYGKGSGGFGPNVKVYGLNLKTKDLPAPHFEVTTKDADGKTHKVDTATRVSGDLIGIRHKEFHLDKQNVIKSVTATLRDGNDVYFVSLPYSWLGRDIVNRFASLKTFGNLEISVYKGKPKGDRPGFDSAAVRQNGELVYGKYPYNDPALPTIPEVTFNGQKHKDFTALNAFYQKMVEEISTAIRTASPVVANEEAAPEAVGAETGAESDVPF